ncbi:MAG TPA: glycosyltransferase family 4 protein, partial [Nitriliruptorales bacterium]|nr:glycosyltransferase family 4 protein [Nitriliruptorales bacterium]
VAPRHDAADRFDRAAPFKVVRAPAATVLPTPGTLRLVRRLAAAHRPDVVVLGATWPLGELAPALRRDPGLPVVGITHGHEAGMAAVGLGAVVRHAARGLSAVTTVSRFAEDRLRPYLAGVPTVRLPPGVDTAVFRPDVDGRTLRRRWGVPASASLVGCVARLVSRKGQDVLLRAWPQVARRHPHARLVLVGSGPQERRLRRMAGGARHALMVGKVSWDELPAAYAALDLFAMPCRTRLLGLDVEGLGIAFLEAQASGVAVVAGRSGGAPETLREGRTGVTVDGRDVHAVAAAVSGLLADPAGRAAMGAAGRAWVQHRWSWDAVARRFRDLLSEVVS